jgi:hypothetical protein
MRFIAFRSSGHGRRWFVKGFTADGELTLTRLPREAEPVEDVDLPCLLAAILDRYDPGRVEVDRWGLSFHEPDGGD